MRARNRFPRHAGDLLTALRIAATPLFLVLVWAAPRRTTAGWAAAVVFAAMAASDIFDGRLARRAGAASPGGRALDHGADILFVVSALSTYAALGVTPWWVPATIAAAFATYAYDARYGGLAGRRPSSRSRIGHTGGVLNYALIGVLVCNESAAIRWLSHEVLLALYALVPVYSAAAIIGRFRFSRHTASHAP
jgi:phosphatidylglycerophosphate synthase